MGCATGFRDLFPTSLDLLGHILEHTPAEYRGTVSDCFERILRHDLRITEAQVEETPSCSAHPIAANPEKPAAVIVDPCHNFIERNLDDNVKRL